jgi:hypothetical protein
LWDLRCGWQAVLLLVVVVVPVLLLQLLALLLEVALRLQLTAGQPAHEDQAEVCLQSTPCDHFF